MRMENNTDSSNNGYHYENEDYIFYTATYEIYIKHDKVLITMNASDFREFLRLLWKEDKSTETFYNNNLFYDNKQKDSDLSFIDIFGTNENIFETLSLKSIKNKVYASLDNLTPIQKAIIIGLFYEEKTEEELSAELNRSRSTISYHKKTALQILGNIFSSEEDLEIE